MNILLKTYKRFQKQITNLSIYFVASLIPMLLSLLINPFIAKNMSPTDYAIVGYYSAFSSLFTPLINFYLLHYYTKRYFELTQDKRQELRATLFKSLIVFSFLLFLVALAILFVYTKWFNPDSQIPFVPYAILSLLPLPITGIYTLTLTDYRMSRQSKKFLRLSVLNALMGTCLALLLVVVFHFGALGKLSASLIAGITMFVYILCINKDVWKTSFNRQIFKDSIIFCWPLVLASMLTFFCTGYDKVILERQGDITTLGIYSVGVSIAGYLGVFSNSINDTFQPDIFESIVKRQYNRCFKVIGVKILIMSVCVALFCLFSPFIIKVLTFGRYVNSTPYAVIVSLSAITSMLYYSVSQITVAMGFTSITLWNKICGSICSIVSFILLISHFGAVGAAWGVVLSYFYFFAGNILFLFIKRHFSRKAI